jgi:uncharacterized integral membrane protein
MKNKIIEFSSKLLNQIIVSILFLGLATINSVSVNASSFSDLSGWAKVCVIISMSIFGIIIIKGLIIPIWNWIVNLVK